MDSINVHDAKTHLSRLLQRVEAGETVVLARSGVPVARLGPIEDTGERELGFLDIRIPDAFFFDPLPEDELDTWEG